MRRIVVVDDAEINRELLHNILKDDFVIDMARDGRGAAEAPPAQERYGGAASGSANAQDGRLFRHSGDEKGRFKRQDSGACDQRREVRGD